MIHSVKDLQSLIEEGKALSRHNPGQAISVWRKAAALAESIHGTAHNTTAFCKNNLATAMLKLSLFPEALPLFQAVIAHMERDLCSVDETLLVTYQNLARAYYGCGDFDGAVQTWTKAVSVATEVLGQSHKTTLYCDRKVALSLVRANRFQEALPLLERQFQQAGREHERGLPYVLAAQELAHCLNRLKRHEAARGYLRAAYNLVRDQFPEEQELFSRLHRALRWTIKTIEEQKQCEQSCRKQRQSLLLMLSEQDRSAVSQLNLSDSQQLQLLQRLRETYCTGTAANHLRLTRKPMGTRPRGAQITRLQRYFDVKAEGVGTAFEEEFDVVDECGERVRLMIGYHAA